MVNFKENVAEFAGWFRENEARARNLIDGGRPQEAYELVAPELRKAMGEIAFQIYKAPSGRYSLEFVTMLDDSKKVVCFYFCDAMAAAVKNRWDFYYYHPAMKGTLTYGERTYAPGDFHIVPSLNKKTKKIDIVVANREDFKQLDDQNRFMVIYMMLSDYIGEMCVDAYIGGISYGRSTLFKKTGAAQEVRLEDLLTYITNTVSDQGWIKPQDIKLIASAFKSKKSKSVGLREDFAYGISYCVDLLNEEGGKEPYLTDYIKSIGVGLYSIATDRDLTNEKKSKARKDEVEKKLSGILNRDKSGFMIHSINGNVRDYADFLLYDPKPLEAIRREITPPDSGSKLIEL